MFLKHMGLTPGYMPDDGGCSPRVPRRYDDTYRTNINGFANAWWIRTDNELRNELYLFSLRPQQVDLWVRVSGTPFPHIHMRIHAIHITRPGPRSMQWCTCTHTQLW